MLRDYTIYLFCSISILIFDASEKKYSKNIFLSIFFLLPFNSVIFSLSKTVIILIQSNVNVKNNDVLSSKHK